LFDLYFLEKITTGKIRINFTGDKGFDVLFQHSVSVIIPHLIQMMAD